MNGFDIISELNPEEHDAQPYESTDKVAKDIEDIEDLVVIRVAHGGQYLARPVDE